MPACYCHYSLPLPGAMCDVLQCLHTFCKEEEVRARGPLHLSRKFLRGGTTDYRDTCPTADAVPYLPLFARAP